jgi:hypothetical protein
MPIRLLSFLNDIENALVKESASNMGPTWETTRMVSYHQSIARMTLTPPKDAESTTVGGSMFLQSFLLSDGSPCLKATLNWEGSNESSIFAVYAKPGMYWKAEAARIASAWLTGPTRAKESRPESTVGQLAAIAS